MRKNKKNYLPQVKSYNSTPKKFNQSLPKIKYTKRQEKIQNKRSSLLVKKEIPANHKRQASDSKLPEINQHSPKKESLEKLEQALKNFSQLKTHKKKIEEDLNKVRSINLDFTSL